MEGHPPKWALRACRLTKVQLSHSLPGSLFSLRWNSRLSSSVTTTIRPIFAHSPHFRQRGFQVTTPSEQTPDGAVLARTALHPRAEHAAPLSTLSASRR